MKNGRNQHDVLGIERTLGLKSDRGISRQSNKEAPPIAAALKDIKRIQTTYVDKPLDEIRGSQPLKDDADQLFEKYAPQIWPGPNEEQPVWLEGPSATRYDGRYPRSLHYTNTDHREILRKAFVELIIEKCINYHENQLQKARRHTAKQLSQQLQGSYGTIFPQPEQTIYQEYQPHQDSGIGASPAEQPRLTDKARTFQEQFAAYTSPVPIMSHGPPPPDGVYARPSSSHSSCVAVLTHHQTSQKRLPGQNPLHPSTKRARIIREDGSRANSLAVRLQVNTSRLRRLAETGSLTPRTNGATNEPTRRYDEQETVRVGIPSSQSNQPANFDPYPSPYQQTLPWNGEQSARQRDAQQSAVHVDLTMEDDEPESTPAPSSSPVRNILGEFADCDVAKELLTNYPNMSRDRLENLQSVLSDFPETRNDLFLLEKRIRALATGPRVFTPAPWASVSQSIRPDLCNKPPAVERTVRLADEILGSLARCPAAVQVLNSYPLMSRDQLQMLRTTLTKYPETQSDFVWLQKLIRFEAWDIVTGATSFPRRPSADGNPKSATPAAAEPREEPKREPWIEPKKEPPSGRTLDNIAVEISWGRELEYSDHMDLQEFDTVTKLFEQIESYLPDELRDERKIKEVRVKPLSDLCGGNIQPRIVRDEIRGKAAVRHLIKKLRAQPPEMEIELAFSVIWDAPV